MTATMKRRPLLIGAIATFAIGLGVGYLTHPASHANDVGSGTAAGVHAKPGNHPEEKEQRGQVRRSTRTQESPVPIRMDAEGNYILPPAMADRLRCNFVDGTKTNADDLRIMGLDDEQIGDIQRLLDDVLQRIAERQRAGMTEFTVNDQEMVWKIRGDRAAAAADKQRLTDGLQQICGAKAGLLSKRMIDEVGNSNVRFCETDYYLRVYLFRPEQDPSYLGFENIVLHPGRSNQSGIITEPPEPGRSFMNYQKQWIFESSGRHGGLVPSDTVMPLLRDKDWQRLIKR